MPAVQAGCSPLVSRWYYVRVPVVSSKARVARLDNPDYDWMEISVRPNDIVTHSVHLKKSNLNESNGNISTERCTRRQSIDSGWSDDRVLASGASRCNATADRQIGRGMTRRLDCQMGGCVSDTTRHWWRCVRATARQRLVKGGCAVVV